MNLRATSLTSRPVVLLACCIAIATAGYSLQQSESQATFQTVAIYKVVPGKHVEFLEWMAAWDEVFEEIGLEQPVWYRTVRGGNFDFIVFYPTWDPSKEEEMERVGKQRGLEIGFGWDVRHWSYLDIRTNTTMTGPLTPAELLDSLRNE